MPSIYARRKHKRCNCCGEDKPLGDYYYSKNAKQYSHQCKPCRNRNQREHRKKCSNASRPTRTREETQILINRGEHVCAMCGEVRSLRDFGGRRVNGNYTIFNLCKSCRKIRKDKLLENPWKRFIYGVRTRCHTFGLTVDDYLDLFQRQKYSCPVCNELLSLRDQALDHDHATGAIRGILHNKCNVLLGLAKDCAQTLRSAAAYLDLHRTSAAL